LGQASRFETVSPAFKRILASSVPEIKVLLRLVATPGDIEDKSECFESGRPERIESAKLKPAK
jgi:hypothetical protein